jgi:hypothetical protein
MAVAATARAFVAFHSSDHCIAADSFMSCSELRHNYRVKPKRLRFDRCKPRVAGAELVYWMIDCWEKYEKLLFLGKQLDWADCAARRPVF